MFLNVLRNDSCSGARIIPVSKTSFPITCAISWLVFFFLKKSKTFSPDFGLCRGSDTLLFGRRGRGQKGKAKSRFFHEAVSRAIDSRSIKKTKTPSKQLNMGVQR